MLLAELKRIVDQPQDQVYEDLHLDHFIRQPLMPAVLIADHGIKGDRKAGRKPRRQLNLLSTDWLAGKQAEGYKTLPGELDEKLTIFGLNVESLPPGSQLQLGDEALIGLTMLRDGRPEVTNVV